MAIKYSPTEVALLGLLPANGDRITVRELAEKFYKKRKRDMPFHGEIYIANSMRSLAVKASKNREKFKLKRTVKSRPIHFWIE